MGQINFSVPRALAEGDDISGFSCGSQLIDSWIAMRARRARKTGTAIVYVSFASEKLAGFYTLSSQSILRDDARGWIARNAPLQIPVILLGMMGVDREFQGQGLGHDLLLNAVRRAQSVANQIGARALVVDPVDEKATAFYRHYGFRAIPETTRMFARLV